MIPHMPTVAALLSLLALTLIPSAQALALALPAESAPAANVTANATGSQARIPYGAYIHHCYVPETIAITFDDGPYIYTEELLGILAEYGAKATFFVNGHNLANNEWLIRRVVNEGHQLASHTWGHPELPVLGYDQIVEQMTSLEAAFSAAVGVIPTYMRPPYLSANEYVFGVMADLGYHVIGASVDTKDYENDHPDLIGRSVEKFNRELDQGGTIVLAHDVHEQTVRTLTRIMLEEVYERGLQPTTVGACLGSENWYR
ncbi:chitin deacetylase [Aspergillus undulatus]|uniref:chitin deacetylase n=1 Tax=Aspergillus undulatus TaxID=1810928 RepID=UPI003CCD6CDB